MNGARGDATETFAAEVEQRVKAAFPELDVYFEAYDSRRRVRGRVSRVDEPGNLVTFKARFSPALDMDDTAGAVIQEVRDRLAKS